MESREADSEQGAILGDGWGTDGGYEQPVVQKSLAEVHRGLRRAEVDRNDRTISEAGFEAESGNLLS